jgi:hypothetical protein
VKNELHIMDNIEQKEREIAILLKKITLFLEKNA